MLHASCFSLLACCSCTAHVVGESKQDALPQPHRHRNPTFSFRFLTEPFRSPAVIVLQQPADRRPFSPHCYSAGTYWCFGGNLKHRIALPHGFQLTEMKGLQLPLFFLCLCSSWLSFVRSYRPALPTPTFAGLRAAQLDLEIKPTPGPVGSSELLKRLSGDPAICGWVEGQASKS